MKIEYRKQTDNDSAPWLVLTNIDELIWNGVYALRVSDDDGTSGLPFRLENNDTVTLVLKDHSHEGMLQNDRTVVQTLTHVERTTGKVQTYLRTRCYSQGNHSWSSWVRATDSDGNTVIDDNHLQQIDANRLAIANEVYRASEVEEQLSSRITELEEKSIGLASIYARNDEITLHVGALLADGDSYGGTSYRAYSDKVYANGELLVVNPDYMISSIRIFNGDATVEFVTDINAYQYKLDGEGVCYQFEFKKCNAKVFSKEELSQVIKQFMRNPIVWNAGMSIDRITAKGTYNICGNRDGGADGLPIYNTGAIEARLTVLVNGDCVTQILTMLNVGGGEGNIYVRSKQGASWSVWGKLQSNIEVGAIGLGQSKSFDDLTDNGIYSGANVYSVGTDANGYPITSYESFVLVVINAYLTGGGVSQLKYSLLLNGTTSVTTRTKHDGVWGEWSSVGAGVIDDEIKSDSPNPVQNKAVAQAFADAVEQGRKLALRSLFIATGAEYNDTEADISKTAPWGETVTHKAGHYYLNGLGDITEEEMAEIYNNKEAVYKLNLPRAYEHSTFRTVLGVYNSHSISSLLSMSYSSFAGNKDLETILWFNKINYDSTIEIERVLIPTTLSHTFSNCNKIKCIHPLNVKNTTSFTNVFSGCENLIEVRLYALKANVDFKDSISISKNSILCIINNASTSSAITLTLHPDAYARLADDADIVTALEAQPLVSLVSA